MSRQALLAAQLVCAVAVAITTAGCGGSDHLTRAPVTGTVTLDGEPLPMGRILFRPKSGRAGRGEIENGVIVEASTYGMNDGIVLGTHQIAIQPIPEVERAAAQRRANARDAEASQATPSYVQGLRQAQAEAAQIPAKYQDVDRSGLTVEITDDENELSIELTSQ